MKKVILIIIFYLFITGCSVITTYTPVVQQGKVIPDEIMQEIKPGMSKKQIEYLLGSPDLIDIFEQNKWIYIYSYQPSYSSIRSQKKLIMTFSKNDKLIKVEGTYNPPREVYERKKQNEN